MSNIFKRFPALLVLLTSSPAWAQRGGSEQPSAPAQPSSEEERWAAEEEPSQLEGPEKESSKSESIPADALLALRSGYGLAGGKLAADGSDLGEVVAGQVPVELDIGALLRNGLYLGVFLHYGFGVLGSASSNACADAERLLPGTEVDCSAFGVRAGVELQYHFGAGKKRKAADPWLGAGFGYDYLQWDVSARNAASSATITQSAGGLEYFSGHFGVDLALADWFALGPYTTFTVSSYDSVAVDCVGACEGVFTGERDIEDTSVHTWAFFGARAVFQISTSSDPE
jgi:hypothetical protein